MLLDGEKVAFTITIEGMCWDTKLPVIPRTKNSQTTDWKIFLLQNILTRMQFLLMRIPSYSVGTAVDTVVGRARRGVNRRLEGRCWQFTSDTHVSSDQLLALTVPRLLIWPAGVVGFACRIGISLSARVLRVEPHLSCSAVSVFLISTIVAWFTESLQTFGFRTA
jgi:hypothetical protein